MDYTVSRQPRCPFVRHPVNFNLKKIVNKNEIVKRIQPYTDIKVLTYCVGTFEQVLNKMVINFCTYTNYSDFVIKIRQNWIVNFLL